MSNNVVNNNTNALVEEDKPKCAEPQEVNVVEDKDCKCKHYTIILNFH